MDTAAISAPAAIAEIGRFFPKYRWAVSYTHHCQMGLQILSLLLHKHYGQECIIIIDEYDTPIQQGHHCNFYPEIVNFMRNFFSGGLKDNPHLAFGFLTGILRVAKESIFSGMNLSLIHISSAAPGTTFVFVPLWKDTIFGRQSDDSNSAVKLPPIRPFSILITGKDASGEKVIGASFSTL